MYKHSIRTIPIECLLILFLLTSNSFSHADTSDRKFPDDVTDSQSLIKQTEALNLYFSQTFKPPTNIVDLHVNSDSALFNKDYQFLTPSKLKSILESGKLTPDEKKIVDDFLNRLAIEYKSGLLFLNDIERKSLYEYPSEVRKNYEKRKKPDNLLDLWSLDSDRHYSERINFYVKKRDEYLYVPPPRLATQDFISIDSLLVARVIKKNKIKPANSKLNQKELIGIWSSSIYVTEPESYYYSEILTISGKNSVKSIESPLYRRKSNSGNQYENEIINKIFDRLKNSLEPKKKYMIESVPLKIIDSDLLDLYATTDKSIEITSTLVRAGFSGCAKHAYNISTLYEIREGRNPIYYDRNAGSKKYFDEMEDLEKIPHQHSSDLFSVMYIYNPEKIKLDRRLNKDGYVRDSELKEELIRYKNCLIGAFSFSIAHELAHLYLGSSKAEFFQPNWNEYLADCNGYNHVYSTFGTVSEKDIFFRIYENLYELSDFRYFGSPIKSSDFKRRTEIIRNALAQNSKTACK